MADEIDADAVGAELASRFWEPGDLDADASNGPATLGQAQGHSQSDKLAILNEIGQLLSSTLSLTTLYETIYQQVTRVLQVDAFFIGLWNPASREIHYVIGMADGRRVPPKVLPLREGMTERVIRTRQPVFIRNYHREGTAYPRPTSWLRRDVPASLLLVPMLHRDKVVGVISVRSYRPYAYDAAAAHLLRTIATQAAIAIENARLYEAQQRRLAELTALYEVGQQMTASTPDLRRLLQLVVAEAVKLTGAESGLVLLAHPATGRLELRAAHGVPEELWGDTEVGVSLAQRCLAGGRPLLLRAGAPGLAHAGVLGQSAQCLIAVPLAIGERLLGVLLLSHGHAAQAFGAEQLESAIRLAGQAAVAIQTADLFDQLHEATVGIMQALGEAIESRDHYTSGHVEEVGGLAVDLAVALGLEDAEIETVRRGALLHDIGKIAVGEQVLQKRGPLTPAELEVMRKHPPIGAQIVQHVKSLAAVVPLVLHHHEKYDGSGYPQGLRGKEIPLGARIIAVADAYHAMTSDRPYRPGMSQHQAVSELLRCVGTHFDPAVVEAFLRVLQQRAATAHEDATAAGRGSEDIGHRAAS
jgi:putative nucleotidyltransferase with HDIG domain